MALNTHGNESIPTAEEKLTKPLKAMHLDAEERMILMTFIEKQAIKTLPKAMNEFLSVPTNGISVYDGAGRLKRRFNPKCGWDVAVTQ